MTEYTPGNDPNIMKYHGLNAVITVGNPNPKLKASEQTSWCGAFVNWCLAQAGYQQRSTVPERALTWGRTAKHAEGWWPGGVNVGAKPIYGAIAVKGRTGGGHVTFVVGKHPTNPQSIICLGGNQGNKLQPLEYYITEVYAFMVPKDYLYQCCDLDAWQGFFVPKGKKKVSEA